jgi:hypothetical protein
LPQAPGELHVALERVFRQSLDGDFAAGDRRGGPEVAGGRGVRLDGEFSSAVVLIPAFKCQVVVAV